MTEGADASWFWERLFGARSGARGLRTLEAGGPAYAPWDTLMGEVARRAGSLRRLGVEPGSTVAAVMTNTYDSVLGALAVWWVGASLASLPERSRGMSVPEYQGALARMVATSEATALLADDLDPPNGDGDGTPALDSRPWSSLDAGAPPFDATPPHPDTPVVIQYSSGSTGSPKGCILRARAIAAQQLMLADMIEVEPGRDVQCAWVPLSHDMGMFGSLLFSVVHDVDLVLSSPRRFMLSPRTWFGDVAETGAGITSGTNTALALAVRAQRSVLPQRLKLHSCVVGAEPIEWHNVEAIVATFAPSGLVPSAIRPSYGMAEATLAVSSNPRGTEPRHLVVDRLAVESDELVLLDPDGNGAAQAISVTSNGLPLDPIKVTVGDTAGPGSPVGGLHIQSPSLADGYLGAPNDHTSALHGGVFRSGDRGFLHDGQVYVLGRTDDVVFDGGRNVHLTDIETAIGQALGLRDRRVLLVDVREGPASEIVAVVEVRRSPPDPDDVWQAAHDISMARCGLPVTSVVFVANGELPATPSGKPQRQRCALRLRNGELRTLAVAGPDRGGDR